MEKISPLRASLKAFEQFKAQRIQKRQENPNTNATNPFGLTFKGITLDADVFTPSASKEVNSNQGGFGDAFVKAGKLASSAWVSTLNRFNSMKQSMISFGNRMKENAINTWDMLNKTEISFTGLFKDSVSSLQKRPVGELEEMFRSELAAI